MYAKKLCFKSIGIMVLIAMLMAIMPVKNVAAQASDVDSALQNGADRLVALQNNDGGWDWPLDNADPDSGSAANTIGPIAQGLAMAYLHTGDATHLDALEDAGAFLLAKTAFSPSDGYLAAQLDEIFGGSVYKDYVKANFYDKLAAGTYVGSSGTYTTASYIQYIQDARSGSLTNMGAWDIGIGLVGAALCGADTSEWITATKEEINLLDDYSDASDPYSYFTLGLSGALYGLAVVGEDIAPTAGYFAGYANINALFDALAGYQNGSGGVVWHPDYMLANDQNENTQSTAYAILAFNEFDRAAYLGNIHAAADYLMGIQLATGGWDNYPEVGTYAASGENNDVTAEALWGIRVAYPLDELWVCETGDCGHPGAEFATIQGAVDAAALGATIHIAAGTYVENVVVDKPLTLIGAGQNDVLIYPALSGSKCTSGGGSICPGSSNVIIVQADDVTISGLTIDGDNPSLTSGILSNGVDVDARNGIIKNTDATYQNLEVYDTTVKNIYLRGIYSTNGSFNFHHNTVTNVDGEYASIAMFAWGGPGIMANNTVSYANDAISANHSKGIQFLNNTVTFSSSGIHTDNSNDGGGVADVIQGNSIDCTGVADAYGIFTFVPYLAPTVEANTVTNCAVGLSAWGEGAPVVTNFIDNIVTGDLSVGSVGAYITTDLIGWGYSDVSVNFTGNEISNFETGLYFTADQQSWNSYPYEEKTINATFTENSITGNTVPVDTGTDGTLNIDLSPNWWGSIGGPAGVMPDEVIFNPWCGDEACSFLVPDANGVITLSGSINIPGGIMVNQPGLTFLLMNGTAIENDSPCFVITADYTTITTESPLGAVCVPTAGDNAIDVNGDRLNIVIEGLEIDGADGTNGIDFDGVVTDLVIRDTYIHSLAGDGIYFAAQPAGTVQIQGNLLMGNGGVGINNPNGTADIDATYNAWGDFAGPTGTNGDGVGTNVAFDTWTHVDLYLESSGTVYADQVVEGSTITYTVYGNLKKAMGAEFTLEFPVELTYVSHTLGGSFGFEDATVSSGTLEFLGYNSESSTPVEGSAVELMTVTFTGSTLGKDLPLGFDAETDLFSMAPGYGPSTNIYATALVGVNDLEVIDLPTLTSNISTVDFITGLESEFTVTLSNPLTGGDFSNVLVNFTIADASVSDIFSLEYEDCSVTPCVWKDDIMLTLTQDGTDVVGFFGPSTGFAMNPGYDVTTTFRVVFKTPGDYEITFTLDDLVNSWQLASLTETAAVSGNFNVTGTVSMQGRSVRSGVPMTLTAITVPVYGPFDANSTNVISNNVLFAGVNGGTYEVTTNQPRYLNIHAELNKQFAVSGDMFLAALELKGGNAIWADNVINILDASKVGTDYGALVDTDADVNFDGVVNIQDLALVGGNFDLTSEVAYGSWTP